MSMQASRGLWLLLWCLGLVACLQHQEDRKPPIRRLTAAITRKFVRAIARTRARTQARRRARTASNVTSGNGKPHILYIVADDLGWNDVGFHKKDMITPNIDALAKSGVILDSFYTPPVCSATRASLLTGRYTHRLGFQHFNPPKAIGGVGAVPLKEKMMPKYFKDQGYATHIIGKWHGGMTKEDYLPHNRGFDTHFGFYEGGIDYYKHTIAGRHDLHYADGKKSGCIKQFSQVDALGKKGIYDLDLFTRRAGKLIEDHDEKTPLFLYLAYHSPHTPNACPKPYYDLYPNEREEWRRVFCGMVTAMDVAVGVTTKKFKEKFKDNYVILFHSDNGGPTYLKGGAENWPLRGGKLSLFEGGQRVIAFVNSPLIDKDKREGKKDLETGLMHVVDVLPTLLHFGLEPDAKLEGGQPGQPLALDGHNMWSVISKGVASPRTEIVHSIDPLGNAKLGTWGPQHMGCKESGEYLGKEGECQLQAALRVGKWKLLVGMWAQCMVVAKKEYTRACGRFNHSNYEMHNDYVVAGTLEKIDAFLPEKFKQKFTKAFGDNSLGAEVALFDIENDEKEMTNEAEKNRDQVAEMLRRIYNERTEKEWMDPQWPPYNSCDTPSGKCDYRPDWYLEAEETAGCAGPYVPEQPKGGGSRGRASVRTIRSFNSTLPPDFVLPPEVAELLDFTE